MTTKIPNCSSIDVGLFLDTDGEVRTCCAGYGSFGNIKDKPLDQMFTYDNPFYNTTKNAMDQQVFPSYCDGCIKTEKLAPGSSQLSYFKEFKSSGKREIKHLDLRWSNVCNLNCRYCDPKASSSWEKLVGQAPQSANRDYHESIFNAVCENIDSLEVVFLLGGEPLMQKQNETLLDIIGVDTRIDIITNLSVNLENNKIYNLLKKQKNVGWHLSFDNVGDRFEYVRSGAEWERLVHNIKLLTEDFGLPHITFHPVYGIWSATRLVEYYDFVAEMGIFNVSWQIAQSSPGPYGNDTFSIYDHNERIKQLAIDQIDAVPDLIVNNSFFAPVKNNLETMPSIPGTSEKFLAWTDRIETLIPPKHSFANLWPELYGVMK